jgi:hypothetical protein
MTARRTNLSNLLSAAREGGEATASSGRWAASRGPDGNVDIYHHTTHMVTVEADGEVVPINEGWGSVSDKCGIRKILGNGSCWTYTGGVASRVYGYNQVYS